MKDQRDDILKGNTVPVVRTGEIVNIAEDDLREGDIVLLQAGDLVPADLKLIEARGLEFDEFELTGELVPVNKVMGEEDVFAYKGSTVTRGNGKGVVIASGEETQYAEILKQHYEPVAYVFPSLIEARYLKLLVLLFPPLIVSLHRHTNLALVCTIYSAMTVFVVLIQNNELFKYIITSGALKRLKTQNIQMQDKTSLDRINNIDTMCLDKTGVLTTREMEVNRIQFADATPDLDRFLSGNKILHLTNVACALCNDVIFLEKISLAGPIDRALIGFASKNGVDINEIALKYRRTYEKPFDSEDRYMACGFELNGEKIHFVKGDPEIVLKMCRTYVTVSSVVKTMDSEVLLSINAKTDTINQRGNVALALAYSSENRNMAPLHYTFLCLLQLENPVKKGAPEVVRKLKENGIRPIIVTGDRPETAVRVGRELGIGNDSYHCLTGKHIAQMDFSDVAKQSDHVSIFARLSPSQKGILVMLLQQRKGSVAMVGDGANDAIALRVADVGISLVENSSPLARRASRILINDLADLLAIVQSARTLKWRVKYLMLFRAIVLTSMVLMLYAWMLN